MSVTFSTKTEPISNARPKASAVRTGLSSTSVIPSDSGLLGQHTERTGAEANNENNIEELRPDPEVPALTQANLKSLEATDPMATSLAFVVSSLLPSETIPIPAFQKMAKVANASVETWRRAARKENGKDVALGPKSGATWGDDTLQIPYGECDVSASAHLSEWEPNWVSKKTTPLKESKEPECPEQEPSPRGVAPGPFFCLHCLSPHYPRGTGGTPEPSCVEQGFAPKHGSS